MGTRMHAASLLALGLAVGVVPCEAEAAPSTPPPPSTTSTPPPPATAQKPGPATATPPPPSGPTTTPPPPTGPDPVTPGVDPSEPEPPPQDLSNTWGYSKQGELKPRYVRTDDPTYAAPNPVGFYSGVSVQGNHVPPLPAKVLGQAPVEMTWTGFERVGEDGSRVFFQLSSAVDHEVTEGKDGMVLRIRMRNTKVNVRNNRRRLDLSYFKTPVREVTVKHKGKDTIATITLKRADTPRVEIIDGKAGYKLLVVEFGAPMAPEIEPEPAPSS